MKRSKHTIILSTVLASVTAEVLMGLRDRAGPLIAKEGMKCLLGATGLGTLVEVMAKTGCALVGNLGISLWANRIAEADDGMNHDLARASGRAISAVIRHASRSNELKRKAAELEGLAKAVEQVHSPRILDTVAGETIPIDPAVVIEDPAGFIGRLALDAAVWQDYLTQIGNAAGVGTHRIGSNIREVAEALSSGYTEALYVELKRDAAADGQAFAGSVLRMLVTIMRRVSDLQQNMLSQHELTTATVDATWRAVCSMRAELRIEPLIAGTEALAEHLGQAREEVEGIRILLSRVPNQLDQVFALLTDLRRVSPQIGPAAMPLHQPNGPDPGFLYYDNVITLVGRAEEARALRAFLNAQAPVSWWLVQGPAGVGKSRLAYDLCLDAVVDGWDAYFLDIEASKNRSWDRWIPTKPTLIVVDYVSSAVEQVAGWIAGVALRESQLGEARVRFLLLERDTTSDWLDALVSGRESTVVARTRTRYRDASGRVAPRMLLEPLGEEAACAMFRAVDAGRFGRCSADRMVTPTDDNIAEAVAFMRENGIEFRPLFLLYAADAVFRGVNLRHWNQAQLSKYMLGQEADKWRKASRALHREGDLRAHMNLLCLATITGGLRLPERGYRAIWETITAHELTDSFPAASAFDSDQALISSMVSLGSDRVGDSLPALRPDYVGEFFALDHVAGKLRPMGTRRRLLALACQLNPDGVRDFLVRASHDFPRHPVLHVFLDLMMTDSTVAASAMSAESRQLCLGWSAANLLSAGEWQLAERMLRAIQEHHAASRYNLAWLMRQFLGDSTDPLGRTGPDILSEVEVLLRSLIAKDPVASMSDEDMKLVRDGILHSAKGPEPEDRIGDAARSAAIQAFESSQDVAQTHSMAVALLAEILINCASGDIPDPKGRSPDALLREAELLFRRKLAIDPWNKDVRGGLLDLLQNFASGKLEDPDRRGAEQLLRLVESMIRDWRIACANDAAPLRALGHFVLGLARFENRDELGIAATREELIDEGLTMLEAALNREWDDIDTCLALLPACTLAKRPEHASGVAEHGLYLVGERPTKSSEMLLLLWALVVLPDMRQHSILTRTARTLMRTRQRFESLECVELLGAARGSSYEPWIRKLCDVVRGKSDLADLRGWPAWCEAVDDVAAEARENGNSEEV